MKKIEYGIFTLAAIMSMASCQSVQTSDSASPQAVDLGLSVKWADMNVGAGESFQTGEYFAWSETSQKEDYAIEGEYKWGRYTEAESPDYGMTKYNTTDSLTVLLSEDDAASAAWGENWRTPTMEEFEELLDPDKCSWEWTALKQKGPFGKVKGYKVTSLVPGFEGNSIFLPATGYRYHCDRRAELKHVGPSGNYWTSTRSDNYPFSAYAAYFTDDEARCDFALRCFGRCIRPVAVE